MLYDFVCRRPYCGDVNERMHAALPFFINELYRGTDDNVARLSLSSSERRKPRIVVANLLRGIEAFFAWLAGAKLWHVEARRSFGNWIPSDLTPYALTTRIKMESKQKYSFLSHLPMKPQLVTASEKTILGSSGAIFKEEVHRFPAEYIVPLFGRVFDDRNLSAIQGITEICALIELLFGDRGSETLQLWTSDVVIADNDVCVNLYHPQSSMVIPKPGKKVSRTTYLESDTEFDPRNQISGRLHVGWKGMRVDEGHLGRTFPLPIPGLKALLRRQLDRYLTETRPSIMVQRQQSGLRNHPFLFVHPSKSARVSIGDPLSMNALRDNWARAISKLGRMMRDPTITVRKSLGTTLHGLRHGYGGIIADLGIPPTERQMLMRHLDPRSTEIYSQPTFSDIGRFLNETEQGQSFDRPAECRRTLAKISDQIIALRGL
jgi:hypothetical protein